VFLAKTRGRLKLGIRGRGQGDIHTINGLGGDPRKTIYPPRRRIGGRRRATCKAFQRRYYELVKNHPVDGTQDWTKGFKKRAGDQWEFMLGPTYFISGDRADGLKKEGVKVDRKCDIKTHGKLGGKH